MHENGKIYAPICTQKKCIICSLCNNNFYQNRIKIILYLSYREFNKEYLKYTVLSNYFCNTINKSL